ncbi:small G protein signaling modulator 3 [Schistosoma bovis]|uniref:RUN and TBC1 domain-containing protein 3 n=1 Tax=Schistosoma bovis TaxID=6184 RepID=A0A430QBJ9_SCHBO|nr:small G protein signaling modulator 3 [Schistosoma bovis]
MPILRKELTEILSFSALVPSLKPSCVYRQLDDQVSSESNVPMLVKRYFDEFGFRIDDLENLPCPFIESSANRRAWLTCLEFSHTHTLGISSLDEYDARYSSVGSTVDEDDDQLWSRVNLRLVQSPRLTELIRGQALDVEALARSGEQLGIPHSLRPHIWPRLTGALLKAKESKQRIPSITYTELVQLSSTDTLLAGIQIEKDLFRTMPNNLCFHSSNSTGISRLRRVLRALAWLYVDVGYCQGMGLIVANLLLCLEEETAFWMMCSIIEDLLPPSYFSSLSLLGVQADQLVLNHLLPFYLPELDARLKEYEISLPLITLQWFLTLYSSVCPTALTFRIWDLLFYDGSVVLFRIALALLSYKSEEILSLNNSSQIFHSLSNAPGSVTDVNELIKAAYSLDDEHLEPSNISSLRRHYLAQLMVDEGAVLKPDSRPNLPKQYLAKRQFQRPKSLFTTLFASVASNGQPYRRITGMAVPFQYSIGNNELSPPSSSIHYKPAYVSVSLHEGSVEADDPKLKNVHQTEILVELKQSIQLIVRHFRINDPEQHGDATAHADYSMESHKLDLDSYVQIVQHRRRRAKALIDFERFELDELEFHKNDILTIINSDDEHCWIGELNGQRGWFPAKFVELLDERGKNYSPAGDDGVDRLIIGLVRGSEQLLHLWFEILCSSVKVVSKWYHPWSYLRSPGWVQIKCELRVLSQFAFHLSPTYELNSLQNFNHIRQTGFTASKLFALSSESLPRRTNKSSSKVISTMGNALDLHKVKPLQRLMTASSVVDPMNDPPCLSLSSILIPNDENLNEIDSNMTTAATETTGDMLVKYHLFSWEL